MFNRKERQNPKFNTTALPDIIFMLLFFFMVVTVMRTNDENPNLQLPKVDFAHALKKHSHFIYISALHSEIDSSVHFYLDQKIYKSEITFFSALKVVKQIIGNEEQIKAKIKIDASVAMKTVNKIKRSLQDLEIYDVEYLVRKPVNLRS